MRRCLLIALLGTLIGAPAAQAITQGSTALVDRPSGFGALPFDGVASSSAGGRSLTPDGRYVVIASASNALLPGDEDSATNVYRVDLASGQIVQVDTSATGGQPTPGSRSFTPAISADGNHVGFFTDSPALVPAANPDSPQYVVKNLATGALELASRANGPQGAAVSGLQFAVLSGDGRHVAFTASSAVQADNATGVPGTVDAYLRSLDSNTTHMESVTTPGGTEGGGVRDQPDVDYGGDAVSFSSDAKLTPADEDTGSDAYVHISSPDQTLLASFSTGQTAGAESGDQTAVAGGPANLDVAWNTSSAEWLAHCAATCTSAAARADHARTGGTDTNSNKSTPFFPPLAGAALPARFYWVDYNGLDPADKNDLPDIYGWDIGNNNFDSSIHLMSPGTPGFAVGIGSATDDGSETAFTSSAPNLPGADGGVGQAFVRKAGIDINVSQPLGRSPQAPAAGSAFLAALHATSDDGRIVAFESEAPALGAVPEVQGLAEQAVARDMATGATKLLSVAPDGTTPGNGTSFAPGVDAAGDRAVFESLASNLVPGDTNEQDDVFLRDLVAGTTTLVDRTAGGRAPLDGAGAPELSADGTKVVFISRSPDIPNSPLDGNRHLYEVDLATGDVTLIDRANDGSVANDDVRQADIDGDGGRVAFVSSATNLGGGTQSVYVRDLTVPGHPSTAWASVPEDGTGTHDRSFDPSIDRKGDRVAFVESDSEFGFGMTGGSQDFVRDLAAHTTTLASVGGAGAANASVGAPSLSADGSRVAFTSGATNLPGAIANQSNVFVRDLGARTTVLGSTRNASPDSGRFGATGGSLSGNGNCLAFSSYSDDLVSGGYGSDFSHVFLHALGAECPPGGAPTIEKFSLTHRKFAVGRRKTAVSADISPRKKKKPKKPLGTAFRITLSEAATTRIAITQKVKGHRSGGKGKQRCKPARRHQKRDCTRVVAVVTLTRAKTKKGKNTIPFSGRFGHRRLATGRYTATATATDAAGNASKPRSARFVVIG